MKSRQLVEDCCFEENLLGDADTPVGTIHSCYDTATAVACSNRFSSMRYNLLQVECGLWVPVDFRTIGHLIPDYKSTIEGVLENVSRTYSYGCRG